LNKFAILLPLVVGIAIVCACFTDHQKLQQTSSWRITSGQITKVKPNESDYVYSRNNLIYTFQFEIEPKVIDYKYSVGRNSYVGQQIFPMSGSLFHANVGDLTSVRYNPAEPGISLLSNELLEHSKRMLLFGIIDIVAALLLLLFPRETAD